MNGMIKAAGLLLLFFACAAAGMYHSCRLRVREKRLGEIVGCLEELDVRLRYEGAERTRLLEEAFGGRGILETQGSRICVCDCGILPEDKLLLEDFLARFGGGDTASEQDRIRLCRELLERNRLAAETAGAQLARLYRTLGICAGAVCCLIFL